MESAQKGMIAQGPYNVFDSTMDEVKKKWGEPDKVDQAGDSFYATYNDKNCVFGFNAKDEVVDIRSYASSLHDLTFEMITHSQGQPAEMRKNNHEHIYVYVLDQQIELKFIISNETGTVDHISVFNPYRGYVLSIEGKSNQLTERAWENMLQWRKEIVSFSKAHEHVYVNGPNKKKVALTFDDGPDEAITSSIIDILDDYNIKGNFFFVGSKVKRYPDVVRKAYDHGHLVLSHSYNHVELSKLAKADVQEEIERAGRAIEQVIGKKPAMLRPPYGETNEQVVAVSQEQGYSIVLWSIDTLDWSQMEAANIVRNVVNNVRHGDIILMHSDADKTETKKALPSIIEALKERDFEIVDLEVLLGEKAYR
nr:polysaccharide deacetylase family protein [Bacillus sp. FJAT-50079]